MLSGPRTRLASLAAHGSRRLAAASRAPSSSPSNGSRSYATNDNPVPTNEVKPKPAPQTVTENHGVPTTSSGMWDKTLQETASEAEAKRVMQAPNRQATWARSQKPRSEAMVGPRFEQAIMEDQPRPLAAIELIHKQPVRWTNKRVVSCDGGGGPLGHPRIFINVDKPQICWCTYCGVPFAHEHHRKLLEAQPTTTYPLEAQDDPAEVPESQSVTGKPLEQR